MNTTIGPIVILLCAGFGATGCCSPKTSPQPAVSFQGASNQTEIWRKLLVESLSANFAAGHPAAGQGFKRIVTASVAECSLSWKVEELFDPPSEPVALIKGWMRTKCIDLGHIIPSSIRAEAYAVKLSLDAPVYTFGDSIPSMGSVTRTYGRTSDFEIPVSDEATANNAVSALRNLQAACAPPVAPVKGQPVKR